MTAGSLRFHGAASWPPPGVHLGHPAGTNPVDSLATVTIAAARTSTARPVPVAPAIRLTAVAKRFGDRPALTDVGFEVGRASVHGLLGPNGAGKTTVLRLLFGLAAPDAGQVEVFGRAPYGNPGAALTAVAGFVEASAFYPYLSAQKNLDFLSGLDDPRDQGANSAGRPDVDTVLARVGLSGRARDKVGGFSTGMRQRLGIAAALLRDPQLLILDEPTSGLDPEGMAELHALIATFADEGRTVLLASHDMSEVEALCSAVTVLAGGRVRYSGSLASLREQSPDPVHAISTADNPAAAELALELGLSVRAERDELIVRADQDRLDEFVVALGRRGLPVRRLSRRDTALEASFRRLTSEPAP